MTVREAVLRGEKRLTDAGIEEAGNDSKELMLFLKNWSYQEYVEALLGSRKNDSAQASYLSPEEESAYEELILRRAERVPLQLITGTAYFYGYAFHVDGHVLIPRYDTETLVHAVLSENSAGGEGGASSVLDLCTGSGCIAAVLKMEGGYPEVEASDIDGEALKTAKENAAALGAKIRFYEGDLFQALPEGKKYDLIVSNPPYIAETERVMLEPEVLRSDPEKALFGGPDGLSFYRRIIPEAARYLKAKGKLYLEIGCTQGEEVARMLKDAGFDEIRVYRDLAGKDRAVRCVLI